MKTTEPYFEKLQSTIHHILLHTPEFEHKYFDQREEKKPEDKMIGYIVVTADKGLAGAYNHNVLKLAEQEMAKHKNTCLFVVGQIGRHYFSRKNVTIDAEFLYTAQNPTLYRARAIAETVTDLFERKYLDEVYVIYTKMINSMDMEPEMLKLFPLEREDFEHPLQKQDHDIVTFRPSPEKVMDHLVPNYMKGLIFGVLVEAFSSEQNARMTAMSGATTSASEMIKELSLQYNRARQAAITQEITENRQPEQMLKRTRVKAFGKGVEIKMEKGKIVEIMGPVVDVEFEKRQATYDKRTLLPYSLTARQRSWKWLSSLATTLSELSCLLQATDLKRIWRSLPQALA